MKLEKKKTKKQRASFCSILACSCVCLCLFYLLSAGATFHGHDDVEDDGVLVSDERGGGGNDDDVSVTNREEDTKLVRTSKHKKVSRAARRALLVLSADTDLDLLAVSNEREDDSTLVDHRFSLHHHDSKALLEKEKEYTTAMKRFREKEISRTSLREIRKAYEEEAEKFHSNDVREAKKETTRSRENNEEDEKTLPASSGLTVYFGVAGGESNCEYTLDKGRWIAAKLNAKKLVMPTCDHLHHSDEDVDLLDYMVEDSLTSCKIINNETGEGKNKFEVASWNHNVNAKNLTTQQRFFGKRKTKDEDKDKDRVDDVINPSHHQVNNVLEGKKILCIEVGHGLCEWEAKQFSPKLEWDAVVYQGEVDASLTKEQGYDVVYVAGVFDYHPHDEITGNWPGLFRMCDPPLYKESIFKEARDLLVRFNLDHPIDPEKTICAHWRQEDFIRKGDPYVENPVEASRIIAEKAREHENLTDVLIITNDPTDEESKTRLETLRSELTKAGLRPHFVHHEKKTHTHDIFIDKAACLLTKGFIGTRASSFSQSIAIMHHLRDRYI